MAPATCGGGRWLVLRLRSPARRSRALVERFLVQLKCVSGVTFNFDVSGAYVGEEERWWFETLSTRGSTRLAPLRVVKELHGRPTDVSPRGAAARESAFIQSYRAELAHFVAVVAGEAEYEAPSDQVLLHKIVEAMYKSADEGREIKL
jgi:predicted dehydrogenase